MIKKNILINFKFLNTINFHNMNGFYLINLIYFEKNLFLIKSKI